MDDVSTIGTRLRILRRWRGMSLAQLSGQAGMSIGQLSMIENGKRALDRRSLIAALAAALRVSETELVGGPHLTADPMQSEPHAAIPALQVALETNSLDSPTADRARPLPGLVTEMRRQSEPLYVACDYVELGKHLPEVLDELHVHVADPADEAAYRLALETLVEACICACWFAHDLGYRDLAYIAANRSAEAAAVLDDPVQRGKAEFARTLSMPRAGSWDRSLIAAERAAGDVQPHVVEPQDICVLGMLTLTAALGATAVHKSDAAKDWLGEAASLATRIPDDPEHNWERFGATNVGVWRVAVAVELGETGGAVLEEARRVDMGKLAAAPSRKSAFLADVGRGLARDPKTSREAISWLQRAEGVAPQRIRNSAPVHETVTVLLQQAKTAAISRELRGMAARMGIPH